MIFVHTAFSVIWITCIKYSRMESLNQEHFLERQSGNRSKKGAIKSAPFLGHKAGRAPLLPTHTTGRYPPKLWSFIVTPTSCLLSWPGEPPGLILPTSTDSWSGKGRIRPCDLNRICFPTSSLSLKDFPVGKGDTRSVKSINSNNKKRILSEHVSVNIVFSETNH